MAYAILRSDNLLSQKNPAGIKSAKYFVSTTATAIENGNVVVLDGLMTGEREVFKAVSPAATNTRDEVFLVSTPEVMYDERMKNLNKFRNEAGKVVRAFALHVGDIFSVTAEALTGTKAVGDKVVTADATTLDTLATVTTEKVIGEIIAKENVGLDTYYVIQVM